MALSLFLFPATAAAWSGKVVGVTDGDSITVLHHGRGEQIRLWGIDCPEKHQDFGNRAKQLTSSLVFGKAVEVEPVTRDRYGRRGLEALEALEAGQAKGLIWWDKVSENPRNGALYPLFRGQK